MTVKASKHPAARQAPKDAGFWLLQISGWLLVLYFVYAQAIPAFDYDLGIAMGTQEPTTQITGVGVAFWKGFAIGDTLTYIPLLIAGLIGHLMQKSWGRLAFAAALGITIYWPAVVLSAVVAAQGAEGWNLTPETAYWIVLPMLALWGAWGLWRLSYENARCQSPD